MMASKQKHPLMHIPISIKAVDLATNHGYTTKTDEQKREIQKRLKLQLTTASMNVPAPNASGGSLKHDTEIDDSWSSLPVIAIHFYEHNPRKANNEAYAEIKESIRVNGILQPLTVTKRPGESHYIIYAGGNTRLHAIRELWEETGDIKYRETRVLIKAWRRESTVLLAHMAENTQRNDMTFWDRANGTLDIKRQMEDERGKSLSYREFEVELKKSGIQTNLQSISVFRFAIEKLFPIGPWLSGLSVRTIQPRLNLLLKLANHHDIEEPIFYAEVVTPTAKSIAGEVEEGLAFSAELVVFRCETALSNRLNLDGRDLSKMLTALERFPDSTLEALQSTCKPSSPIASGHRSEIVNRPVSGQAKGQAPLVDQVPSPVEPTMPATQWDEDSAPSHSAAGPQASLNAYPVTSDCMEKSGSLKTLIQRVLVDADLGSCYEPMPNMPMGYYMGFPKDGPLDLKENAQSRQAAWWVLAMASGQFSPELCRTGLDESSEWRTLILEESNQETLGGLELAIQHNIGGQGEFLPIPWLLNPNNPIAGRCLELLAAIRGGAAS